MKKADLEKRIAKIAADRNVSFEYTGGTNHDKFKINGTVVMVPRHKEIGEMLAKTIIKQATKAAEGK